MKPRPPAPQHFEPAEADIQRCAYFLWKEEGSPTGRDLDLWLAAKEFLRHRLLNRRTRTVPRRRVSN